MINLGVYKHARRIYDRFDPSRETWIRESMEAYAAFLRPGDLCFDVGANIGLKTEAMLRLGARVVAVEPQPRCIRELEALQGSRPGFVCVPKAVGREPGRARLYLAPDTEQSSLRADWFDQREGEIEVEVTTLDALIEAHGVPHFCKLDVEGFELEALYGLSLPVEFLSFEYNIRYLDEALACIDYLKRFGASRFYLSVMEPCHLPSPEQWWDHDSFLERFRAVIDRNP